MKSHIHSRLLLVFIAAVLSACASKPQSGAAVQPAPATTATASTSATAGAPTTATPATSAPATSAVVADVPTLKVVLDCGACEVKPNIAGLVIDGYTQAAAKVGAKVSAANEATLTIKEYRARGDAARFFVGIFAGRDEIKAVITYQGKTFMVEDYYSNAWQGIDSVAKNIGEMAYGQLK